MRQAASVTIIRKYLYSIVLVGIVILLVLLGSFQNTQLGVKGEEIQKSSPATGLSKNTEAVDDSTDLNQSSSNLGTSSNKNSSSPSSFSLSIKSSTKTSGNQISGSLDIDTNINGATFGGIFEDCLENGESETNKDGTKVECEWDDGNLSVDFKSKNKQSTKNKSSSETKVRVKNKSH